MKIFRKKWCTEVPPLSVYLHKRIIAMYEELIFESRDEFREWLVKNHAVSQGIWMVFGKDGLLKTIKRDEALEEALCFGWIDGQIKSVDQAKYVKKFTPRRKGSQWSEKNKILVHALTESGKMTAAGMAAVERAKKSGQWNTRQTESIGEEQVGILIDALSGADLALSNFMKMPDSVKKTYTALYLDAKKEETRIKRLEKIIGRLNENKKPM